jgi:hypothetical protein
MGVPAVIATILPQFDKFLPQFPERRVFGTWGDVE